MPATEISPRARPTPPRLDPPRAPFPLRRPVQPKPIIACESRHDFLVPNPRPDLTFDPQTLNMLSVS